MATPVIAGWEIGGSVGSEVGLQRCFPGQSAARHRRSPARRVSHAPVQPRTIWLPGLSGVSANPPRAAVRATRFWRRQDANGLNRRRLSQSAN